MVLHHLEDQQQLHSSQRDCGWGAVRTVTLQRCQHIASLLVLTLQEHQEHRPHVSMRRTQPGATLSPGWTPNHDLCAWLSSVCREILVRHWWLMTFEKALGLDTVRNRVIACHWGQDLWCLNAYVYGPGWHMLVLGSCSKCEVQKCFKMFKSILHVFYHMVTIFMACFYPFSIFSKTSVAAGGNTPFQ